MLDAPTFKNNPTLYAFLPVFYLVWTDAVLTPTEIDNMKLLIGSQLWLTAEEREFLITNLDPKHPPTPDELKAWKKELKEIANDLDPDLNKSIATTGLKLAEKYGSTASELAEKKDFFNEMEAFVGVMGSEAFHTIPSGNTIAESLATKETFDQDIMTDILDGSQKEMIRKVKVLLSDPKFSYYTGENTADYREQVLTWCKYLAEQGYGSMAYPTEYGGEDDMEQYFTIMETLSYHDLSMVIKFGVQFGLWGMSVYFLGTKKHHDKYLEKIGTLELPGCFAMTETGHGSNVKGIETTATYDHVKQTFIINTPNEAARKEYIGNAALHGHMATVFAKLIIDEVDYGVNAFVVPLRNNSADILPGVKIEDCGHKMGLNGVDNGIIYFDQVTIPKENMLDKFASVTDDGKFTSPISSDNRRFFTMLGTLVGGRIGIPRSGLSATKSGLTIAIRYGAGRRQFGPENRTEVPILNYRTHQRRLMPLLANAYALHFSLQYLTQRFLNRTEEDMMEIEAIAAGMKAYATWNTSHTLQECREACGGKGYLSVNRLDALKNDTEIFTTFEGDNTVLMQLVAKSRLTEFKQEFSNMDFFGIVNYVGGQAKTVIQKKNPIAKRKTDKSHLLDSQFHLEMFRDRERDILNSAAQRLKKHLDSGMDSFDAFNQTQYHLLHVGQAYIERIILEQFLQGIEQVKDAACQQSLQQLCDLYALSTIEKNKGWYLEHDYMEGSKTKAIRKLVNELCWEVRQEAVPLVNAFNIPDYCLGAPIATSDVA
jgi:acyl-CoA oxidase